MMIEMWKPLYIKDKYVNVLKTKINQSFLKIPIRFLVFYVNNNKCYLTKIKETIPDGKLREWKNKKSKFDALITFLEPTYDNFYHFVDCSQIFVMNKNDLQIMVDFNYDFNKKTHNLSDYYKSEILDGIKNCIFDKEPYFSILELKFDKNKNLEVKNKYICSKKTKNKKIFGENYGIRFCDKILNNFFPLEIKYFNKKINLKELGK